MPELCHSYEETYFLNLAHSVMSMTDLRVCALPLTGITAAEVIALWFVYGSVCSCMYKPHDQRLEQNVGASLKNSKLSET